MDILAAVLIGGVAGVAVGAVVLVLWPVVKECWRGATEQ